ncbi:uncharacterized protein LOC122512583 [Leptopilina heterotoma]|uniref:uncharacterized protein LOC122512583 n=1 Tax=Leptopilina heterotoma TaxID=63436 RepID=UPI001CA92765|nr:uncharacterized protein LOC122512583 [Leptopilina heterotoma]
MEKTLYKSIVKYYSYLKIVSTTWNDVISSAKEQINGLKSLCEQFRLITSVDADQTEIYKQNGLKEKLQIKVFRAIQNEIAIIGNFLNRLNKINQELKNKFARIEEARSKVSLRDLEMKQLINGTPLIPRLEKLILWAKESQDYYPSLLQSVSENFNSLDHNDENTIVNFEKSFNINYFWKIKIDNILRFTETISRVNVS